MVEEITTYFNGASPRARARQNRFLDLSETPFDRRLLWFLGHFWTPKSGYLTCFEPLFGGRCVRKPDDFGHFGTPKSGYLTYFEPLLEPI